MEAEQNTLDVSWFTLHYDLAVEICIFYHWNMYFPVSLDALPQGYNMKIIQYFILCQGHLLVETQW